MSTVIYPKYRLPFLQFIFESLALLTLTVALLPGAYLSVFIITIPLLIACLVLSQVQDSGLYKFDAINVFVSFLLLYFAYNSVHSTQFGVVFVLLNTLLTGVGIALCLSVIISIAQDVSKHYRVTQKASNIIDKSKAETIKPVFSTKKKSKK